VRVSSAREKDTGSAQLEFELLVCCARPSPTDDVRTEIRRRVALRVDWAFLIRLAARHNLLPLLGWNLSTICPKLVPESVLRRLEENLSAVAGHNLCLTSELHRIIKVFQACSIPLATFKGPTLACLAYKNIALRPFEDLDLLIHRNDVLRARDALASIGYRLPSPLDRPGVLLLSEYAFPFVKQGARPVHIDLHCEIAPWFFSFPLDTVELIKRVVQVPLPGGIVPSLVLEDLILVLCVHGTKHLWSCLESVASLAGIINATPQLCWDEILTRAKDTGAERMLLLGCVLARDLFGASLPSIVDSAIGRDTRVGLLAAWVQDRFVKPTNNLETQTDAPWFHLKCRERFGDRFRYLARGVLSPEIDDVRCLTLPTSLSPVYRLLHPARILSAYTRSTVQRILSFAKASE